MKQIKFFALGLALCLSAQLLSAQSANAQTVMNIYASFGRGDIPSILATLSPNCSWYSNGNPAIVPFAGAFIGRDEIAAKFFAIHQTSVEITGFEPSIVGEEGKTVVASVKIQGKAIAIGKTFQGTHIMRWIFDDAGKIVKHENLFNPASLEAALTK
jgi:uncharacterized protein